MGATYFADPNRAIRFLKTLLMLSAMCWVLPAGAQTVETTGGSQTGPPQAAPAQQDPDPWRNLKFGATLEGYYQYNWNRPPTAPSS